LHIEEGATVEDVERLLNKFYERNKEKIKKIYDVTISQNTHRTDLTGMIWYGEITYWEKASKRYKVATH
jgi:hypothetical protein